MLLPFLNTATSPPRAPVVDPEPPTVPYLHGAGPWPNPPVPIMADHVTTEDGSVVHGTEGSYVHPSVLDFATLTPEGAWGGHRYWMGNSEYSTHGREDTMILASEDGYNWAQPEGADPGPVWRTTDQLPYRAGVNTDVELAYDPGADVLVQLWRQDNNDDRGLPARLWYSESSDGIGWTTPQQILEGETHSFISPSVVPDGRGGWWMFSWGNSPARRTAATLAGPWSSPVPTTGIRPWHGGVWRDPLAGKVYGIGGVGGTSLVAFVSDDDGLTFQQKATVLNSRPDSWDHRNLYRPTMQPHPDGEHFRVWYSTNGYPGPDNRTGYVIVPRSKWD